MDAATLLANLADVSRGFAADRAARQQRRHLERADFDAIRDAGYLLVGVPEADGGLWQDVPRTARIICDALRTLAHGDSSVALVSAMHPAVLSYWLTGPEKLDDAGAWDAQRREIFDGVKNGDWWGTITSEPGSGGDITRTRTQAEPADGPLKYLLSGQKHFGSGSGMMHLMVTTALAAGESQPDWFYLDTRNLPPEGNEQAKMIAAWDGHGMIATQSHAFRFEKFPATRIAWQGHLLDVAQRAGGFIGCLFTAVIVGIGEVAMETAAAKLKWDDAGAFAQAEWARAKMEHWLIAQAYEGMLRALEMQDDPRHDVLQGKTAIAELSEALLLRLCKLVGGSTFARHSPFGYWFEDVRALGFLRPPWTLAWDMLVKAAVESES